MRDLGLAELKLALVAAGGMVAVLLGGVDTALKALVLMVVADIVTGVLTAVVTRTLSSEVSWRGGLKKLTIFIAVAVATALDSVVGGPNDPEVLRAIVITYYLGTEGISILENMALMGLPVPAQLRERLVRLRDAAGHERHGPS